MEIPKTGPAAGPVKTEWKGNVNQAENADKSAPGVESFGAQLNRMAGTAPQGRNLYEKKGEMSKEAYLKMLMEQIKFQDPFNPVKNEQFSQQMTALSQLEQQVNTNKNLERIVQQQSNQQIAALQLVGKNITADRAAIYHDKDKPSNLTFKLPMDASELSVDILGANGEKIKSIPIGGKEKGDITTKWDGFIDQGAPAEAGRYSYRVNAKGMDGKEITISTKIDGRVTGVTNSQGVTYLLVGEQRVGLSDIEVIKEGGTAASEDPASAAPTNSPLPGNLAGMIPESNKSASKEGEEKPTPQVSIRSDAANSLSDSGSPDGEINPLMPIFMR